MLFEEEKVESGKTVRPALPTGAVMDYQIGFLFNFNSGKSTRFDLEPVLIYNAKSNPEYKRISMQVDKGLAYLQPLDDSFYNNLIQFTDSRLLEWMIRTGNRFIRNANTGSWAHTTSKGLVNIRRRYRDILEKLWPTLCNWPDIFILRKGRFVNHQQQRIKLSKQTPKVRFSVNRSNDHIALSMILLLDGQPSEIKLLGGFLLEQDDTLYLPDAEILAIVDLFKNGPLTFPLSVKKNVINKYILPWLQKYEVSISDTLNIQLLKSEFQSRIRLSELNESNLMIRPEFLYDDEVIDYDDEYYHVVEKQEETVIMQRNKEDEKKLYEYLRTLHPAFTSQRNNLYYYLPFAEVMKRGWLITMMRNVLDNGYAIHGLPELKKFRYSTHSPTFTIAATSNKDFFKLKITVQWGEQIIALKEIRHAILNGQNTIMLDDGTLGHIPDEWVTNYSLLLQTGKEQDGVLTVSKIHYMLMEDILDRFDKKGKGEIELRKRKLLEYDAVEKEPLSKEIKASLRPYQLSGFHWLQALDELSWGGCLADDMGLGKTLQTISFIQFVKEKYPGSTQLVVCPTSLIFNWENELQKFCPSLKYHIHYGTKREFTENHFKDYDVVLTSYGVVRNDLEELTNFLWQYIILDESQAIKNPDAQVAKAVKKLRSVNRIILSGTPVQNNTFDLFAQFNFLNPGLLGSREFFDREFATPIDKLGSQEKTKHLRKIIYPFTLRRTKEQVASDLPDKTISVLWCAMPAEQRKLYNRYRDAYKERLLKKIDEEGIQKSGLDVLEGLLRLRQICDHPALVNKAENKLNNIITVSEESLRSSVKIEELIREVEENAGNHKILIFSQFTEMLQLIKQEFTKSRITHCYLDGSTPMHQRKEEVTRFQEDERITAFLISLKAGGVGLNLTVADYVYIVDPWWNPAAEHQAIDRAHRIGQTRKVFAYKMICKDSVEEKILQLQQKKKMLADDLIKEDASFVKTLSREDVEFLFG